ncbi:glycosyl hydrolase family 28-related protein [Luteimicrobium subarcticum]|uniref:Pectate lyase-like protein n=1 Tax=Luteimicrobium subarcticum TaxID=620910 RepID=A0A2M8W1N7_9MICO|nr:glycosyl hydrolase family 28-related protein [Luteimicrobium subarcticum]PJI84834.1 pectate lyase-like protein [Luteimicrobium subarcticum]
MTPSHRRSPAPTRARWSRTALASTTALVTAAGVLASGGTALAHSTAPAPTPVTRASLDPALVAGRGADLGVQEQEAENATTDGTVLAKSRDAYTLAAEASGRSAVSLRAGQHVDFTLPQAANAITVRYSIPDSPQGGGMTAPLAVTATSGKQTLVNRTMTLTSQYAWLYNAYPFTNDPTLTTSIQPDWWTTECGCAPGTTTTFAAPFRPNHFYDEQRLLLGRTLPAGTVVRLTAPAGSTASTTTIDLLDSQVVAPPKVRLVAANVLLFGADPTGRRDAAPAIEKAIAFAKAHRLPVYLPPGIYQVNRHIVVDGVTIEGAGSWYTIVKGKQVTLDEPSADGSVHTGVGFYGKDAADGGSKNVHLSGFAIEGDVRDRVDTDQVNGIGGALSDSTIDGLYIHHTKVGLWFDGPMTNLSVTNNVVADQIADGINFHGGVTDSAIRNNSFRNTGDDAIALWSEATEDARDVVDHNTVQTPVLANGIALYGGEDNTVSSNLVADPIREGSALHLGARFGAQPFAGYAKLTDNTTVRAGGLDLNWKIGLGALWMYALDRSIDADVQVTGDTFLDSTYNALMEVTEYGVKDQYSIPHVAYKDVRVDGAGTSVISARTAGGASFENVDVRGVGWAAVNNCGAFNWAPTGSEFTLTDLGSNDGVDNNPWNTGTNWLHRYTPNALTCNDAPPVVTPAAPSTWVTPPHGD